MVSKKFTYPLKVQRSKYQVKFTAILPILLITILMIRVDFKSTFEFLAALFFPLLMTLGSVLYLGAWADLEIDDEGIYVEFLWKKLYVPWQDIVATKGYGFSLSSATVILVNRNRLTWFHIIYSLFTVGSFLPCFHIYPALVHSKELLHIINRHISNKGKAI